MIFRDALGGTQIQRTWSGGGNTPVPGGSRNTVTTHLLQEDKTTRILGVEGMLHSLMAHKGPADIYIYIYI